METKGITCKIPLDLHEQISEEMRESGRTVSQYMEMIIREHLEGGSNCSGKSRNTLPGMRKSTTGN